MCMCVSGMVKDSDLLFNLKHVQRLRNRLLPNLQGLVKELFVFGGPFASSLMIFGRRLILRLATGLPLALVASLEGSALIFCLYLKGNGKMVE